jgi:hypothetical protein
VCRFATAKRFFTSDSDERERTHDLLGEVARTISRARLGFVSFGPIETARDDCARFGAIRVGDCLQVSRPQREGELFCLASLRPEPDGTKAVRSTSAAKNAEQG